MTIDHCSGRSPTLSISESFCIVDIQVTFSRGVMDKLKC